MGSAILEVRNLTKEFRGFTAVDDVNLQVQEGHIHALIGPNGAGKTTVFNLLTKFLPPTRGEILYRGKPITGMKANEIARLGLCLLYTSPSPRDRTRSRMPSSA